MNKDLFEKLWKKTEDVFEGLQTIESKVLNRRLPIQRRSAHNYFTR